MATNSGEAPAASEGALEVEDEVASTVGTASPRGSRRKAGGGEGPAAKRPRYNDTPFAELTITDLENACREVISLKRKLDTATKELDRLKDLRSEKAALAKTIKALEVEVAKSEKQADNLKDLRDEKAALAKQIKELESDAAKNEKQENAKDIKTQVERIKRAIRQNLTHEMIYLPGMKDMLMGNGREICCFIPNVDAEVVKALGCDSGVGGQAKTKYIDALLGEFPQRLHNNNKLIATRTVSVKYIKTACELRVDATYVLAEAKKAPVVGQAKARAKGKGKAKAKARAAAAAAARSGEGEDEEGQGEENEGADDDDEGNEQGEENEDGGKGEGEGEDEQDDEAAPEEEEAALAAAPAAAEADTPKKVPVNID
mmetsp:Transcript_10167/g.22498  ORF Transcript_10167/g.22498 Transcript_10167/m.22498 type:complete len:373 (+) Transcript_10167:232-1350(+)|eukprot:CAMPEP_0206447460 /NCGR_PEP_ID=MMETSP0324_2-20121206/16822_1 /ASSEMBLY_ACC=CAM_ASM_000836 /TAXON_ID=2866 /ORGANISM="Crypthecodinium cohnii, Strain Seligo" /LENGTH=372 /DNA_ID=CAMNT_0053916281 /DNA_START=226 /DNA_END=1344 /DNA_ORIENTATION=+